MKPIVHEDCDIFLETFLFFFFFVAGIAYVVAWEAEGTGIALLWGFAVSSNRLLECEPELSVWKRASVAEPLIFQTRSGCCHAPSSLPAGAKGALKWHFARSTHAPVSLKAFVCTARAGGVRLVFWGTVEWWLLRRSTFCWGGVLHLAGVISTCKAQKWVRMLHMLKNHTIKVYGTESSSGTKPAFFFSLSLSVHFASPFFSMGCIKCLTTLKWAFTTLLCFWKWLSILKYRLYSCPEDVVLKSSSTPLLF